MNKYTKESEVEVKMSRETGKKKILVVDDAPDTRLLIKRCLEKSDYEVLEAENGMDALVMVKGDLPDLIILDMMIPRMDGLKVCAFIKSDKRSWNIPVIMITAMAEKSAKELSEQVKVDVFLNKPIIISDLLQKVKELIGRVV